MNRGGECMNSNELYHHGVKGMKWGVRRNRESSTKTGNKNFSIKKKAGKALVKRVEKSREKAEKHNDSIKRTTDRFGVGGVALGSYMRYQSKKSSKAVLANVVNAAANVYISSPSGNYYAKRGADFARRAVISGLSISSYSDLVQAYADVGKSAIYASSKKR